MPSPVFLWMSVCVFLPALVSVSDSLSVSVTSDHVIHTVQCVIRHSMWSDTVLRYTVCDQRLYWDAQCSTWSDTVLRYFSAVCNRRLYWDTQCSIWSDTVLRYTVQYVIRDCTEIHSAVQYVIRDCTEIHSAVYDQILYWDIQCSMLSETVLRYTVQYSMWSETALRYTVQYVIKSKLNHILLVTYTWLADDNASVVKCLCF
jgi:hypothetical protein